MRGTQFPEEKRENVAFFSRREREVREALARDDEARALLRRLFVTPANLLPDPAAKTLTVELHRLGSPLQDAAVARLCQLLTDSETLFPTTNLRLIFRQVGST